MELYKTVKKEAEAEQIIEKSRFTAHVKPVETKEEADEFIASVKSRYKDATHNVPAMVLGDKFQIQWASDDGEPQGTSGAPIVQMLVKEGITNVAVVVTRYFGGIKLGTGGLVRAYTSSAKLGIDAAQVCAVCEICLLKIKIDYTFLAKLQNMASGVLKKMHLKQHLLSMKYSIWTRSQWIFSQLSTERIMCLLCLQILRLELLRSSRKKLC